MPLRAKTTSAERRQVRPEKEDGILKSMRLLLTWLSEYPGLYKTVSAYVKPEDFTDELYKEVAEMLYEQLEKGELNPARIINHFTDPQQQRTAAQIFNTKVRAESQAEQEKSDPREHLQGCQPWDHAENKRTGCGRYTGTAETDRGKKTAAGTGTAAYFPVAGRN